MLCSHCSVTWRLKELIVFCTLFLKLNFFLSRNGGSDEAKTKVQVLGVLFHTLKIKIQYSSYKLYVYDDYPIFNLKCN